MEAIAVHPHNKNVIFAGAVNGGVWRTTNGGTSWDPLTDQFTSLSISALAVSPLDADGQPLTDNYMGTGNPTPVNKLVVFAGTGRTSSFSSQLANSVFRFSERRHQRKVTIRIFFGSIATLQHPAARAAHQRGQVIPRLARDAVCAGPLNSRRPLRSVDGASLRQISATRRYAR